MIRPAALLLSEGPGELEDHAFFSPRGHGFADLGLLEVDHDIFRTNGGNDADQRQKRDREAVTHVISSPRIVPVDEANLFSSRPIRWSIETKRFGNG